MSSEVSVALVFLVLIASLPISLLIAGRAFVQMHRAALQHLAETQVLGGTPAKVVEAQVTMQHEAYRDHQAAERERIERMRERVPRDVAGGN